MAQLMQIENRHSVSPPSVPTDGYRGYFENMQGEQLIYHQAKGEPRAWLWHGDTAFEPTPVERGQATDKILDLGERLWVLACWQESAFLRVGGFPDKDTQETAEEVAIAVVAPAEAIMASPAFAQALVSEIQKRMPPSPD